MTELQLRATLCEVGRRLWQRGLIGASEGNLSVRLNSKYLLCTPSGASKGHLKPNDLVVIDLKGNPVRDTDARPSSEIKLHLRCYQIRKDCQAVIHAHPQTATGFALAGEEIPDNLMPEAAIVLGSVATVPFAMPGTNEVPDLLEPLLPDHKTFLPPITRRSCCPTTARPCSGKTCGTPTTGWRRSSASPESSSLPDSSTRLFRCRPRLSTTFSPTP